MSVKDIKVQLSRVASKFIPGDIRRQIRLDDLGVPYDHIVEKADLMALLQESTLEKIAKMSVKEIKVLFQLETSIT